MSCAKLKLMFVIVLWLCALISLGCAWESSGDAMPSPTGCLNCTICQYPCHPLPPPDSGAPPPPLLPGNPTYGPPPPPPPPPSLPGYPQGKCPPIPGVQCCQNTPFAPPYAYVPYGNFASSFPMPIFPCVIMILLFSCTVLF